MAKPFLKWAGGKTKLLPEILKHVPPKYGTYFEPFVGGGAVLFALNPSKAVIGDTNARLINTFRVVRETPNVLAALLSKMVVNEAEYYKTRERFNNYPRGYQTEAEHAADFIYLNKTGYNGLYRENRNGSYNTPWGKKAPTTALVDTENLAACSAALANVWAHCMDYESLVAQAAPGDFVYFDPPYIPVADASFVSYGKAGFTLAQHYRLAEVARGLKVRGVHVLLSNSHTPRALEIYGGFNTEIVKAPRAINSKASGRGLTEELLIW